MKRNSFQIQSLQLKLKSALLQNSIVKTGLQSLSTNLKTAGLLAKRSWNYVEDFFLRLQIRLKLSIIVAISIIGTTLIIGTIVTRLQEEELKLQTEALGHSIVVGLNSSAKDNLLLNSPSIIQDYVNNFSNLKIPGLERLFVVDRERTIVANLNPNELKSFVVEGDGRSSCARPRLTRSSPLGNGLGIGPFPL